MKWFKHVSDSLDDPFIFDLMCKFGGDGYLTFFGIVEIYSREFNTEVGWKLSVTRDYLKRKLCKRQATLIIKSLEFIKNSGKWEVDFNGENVTIYIPKFRELLDETTLKKLRQKEELFRNRSGELPKKVATDKDIDKDIDKEEEKEDCPHQEIVAMYHETMPELPKIAKWTPKRATSLRTCWKDKSRQSLEWWKDYFLKVRTSPFLMGDNQRGWKADLEWLTNETNLVKVLEGKYNGNGDQSPAKAQRPKVKVLSSVKCPTCGESVLSVNLMGDRCPNCWR